uniref:MIR domain-containing protein n=1 Tax=Macrostomum lignano TaxID=282301 RepID=A0A1I8H486_9PLAT
MPPHGHSHNDGGGNGGGGGVGDTVHSQDGQMRERLHIGDWVALFNTGTQGYFCWNGSSESSYNEPMFYFDQSMEKPEGVRNYRSTKRVGDMRNWPQVCQNGPTSSRRSRNWHIWPEIWPANAQNEDRDNQLEMRRSVGREVRFGEIIQLRHVPTGFYLHVDSTSLSNMLVSNLRACLKPGNGITAQMYIRPQFKVKSNGDPVTFSDPVTLESLKFHLHALCAFTPYCELADEPESTAAARASVRIKRNSSTRNKGVFSSTYGSEAAMINTKNVLERQFSAAHKNHLVFSSAHPLKLRYLEQSEASFTVDVSNRSSGFMLVLSMSHIEQLNASRKDAERIIHGLDLVRLCHTELQGNLAAEGSFNQQSEDVHLRLRPMDNANLKTFVPTSNANVFWQVELEKSPLSAEPLQCTDLLRFRHATTGMYLSVSVDGKVQLLPESMEEIERVTTVFRVQTAHKGAQFLRDPSIGIIENVITGRRLKVRQDCDYHKRSSPTTMGPTMESIQCDDAQLRQVEAEQKVDSDNAFKLVKVESEAVDAYSMVSGFSDAFFPMLEWVRNGYDFPAKEFAFFVSFLEKIRDELVEETGPSKLKQKMMRSLKVIDCALDMAEEIVRQKSLQEESVVKLLCSINALLFQVVYHYLMGRSSKNRFYIARYFGLMHSLVDLRKDEGRSVMMALNQFVEDNRIIVDRITEAHVNTLIDLLQEWKNYLFLIFLTSYCVCDGTAIQKNQQYIIKSWFLKTEQGLCLFRTGQSINRIRNLLYISTDTGRTYIPMHVFVDFNSPVYSESSFRYLVQQLNLMVALCAERNIEGIQQITSSLELINWDSAFLCLRSDIMPSDIRAKFCEVITVMFIDVGTRYSIVEHTLTCFDYVKNAEEVEKANETLPQPEFDEVPDTVTGASSSSIEFEMQTSKGGAAGGASGNEDKILDLMDWAEKYLLESRHMVQDNFAENVFLKQVFELIAVLVKFGFYSEQVACARLSDTILEVLDGRTDYPSLKLRDEHRAESEKALLRRFRETDRYRVKFENRFMLKAKVRGIDVLTLIMDQVKNQCLGEYIRLFIAAKHYRQEEANLRICTFLSILDEDFNPDASDAKSQRQVAKMKQQIIQMYNSVQVINMQRFQSVMLDLALYSTDDLVQKATAAMCKYFFAKSGMYESARRAYFCSTEESRRLHLRLLNKMPKLRILIHSQWGKHNCRRMIRILRELAGYCRYQGQPHLINQMIILSHDAMDLVDGILSRPHHTLETEDQHDELFQEMVNFIDVWCRGNDVISQQVFQRMPFILSLEHNYASTVPLFIGVFQQCAAFQEQMTERDFKQIIDIAIKCQRKLPEVFYLLIRSTYSSSTADLNLRNISIIIKLVMENYSRMGGISGDWRAWKEALEDPESSDYYLAFLELLTCCCRLMLLCAEDIDAIVRSLEELPQEEICMIMKAQEVKQPAGNFNVMSGMELKVNYIMDGLLPMTVSLLSRVFYPMALTDESAKASFEQFLSSLNSFACLVSQYAMNQYQLCTLLGWFEKVEQMKAETLNRVSAWHSELVKMIDAAKDACTVMGYFAEKHVIGEEERLALISHFAEELTTYDEFIKFNDRCRRVYEGRNTVEAQVHGVDRNPACYSEIGTVKELPLGEEFQHFIDTFLDKNYSDLIPEHWRNRYRNLGVLVAQVHSAGLLSGLRGREKERQEELNVRCLQVLRGAIHNQVHNPNEAMSAHLIDPLSKSSKQIYAFLQMLLFNVSEVQQQDMIDFFVTTRVEHFFCALDSLLKDLGLQIKRRRDARRKREFTEQRGRFAFNEQFELVRLASDSIRYTEANLKRKSDAQRYAMYTQLEEPQSSLQDGTGECTMKIMSQMCDGQFKPLQNYLRVQEDNYTSFNVLNNLASVVHLIYANVDCENIDLLVAMLDTLNEVAAGNHSNRIELVNNKVVDVLNVLLRTRELPDCSPQQVLALREMMANVLITLVEENGPQEASLAEEIKNTIDVAAMYKLMAQLAGMSKPAAEPDLQDLVRLPRKVRLPSTCIGRFGWRLRESRVAKFYRLRKLEDVKQDLVEVGFKYFIVLARFNDLDKELYKRIDDPDREYLKAYKYMSKFGDSVEIVKDECLHRVHFRVQSRHVLREEVKEDIKWKTNFWDPSEKQRICSAGPTPSSLTRLWLVWNWLPVLISLAITILSMIAFKPKWAYRMALPPNTTVTPPAQVYDAVPDVKSDLRPAIFGLALVHSFVCAILFASFVLLNRPGWNNLAGLRKLFTCRGWTLLKLSKTTSSPSSGADAEEDDSVSDVDVGEADGGANRGESEGMKGRGGQDEVGGDEIQDEYTEAKRINRLEVHFIGPETFYYGLLLVLSVVGTIFGYYDNWGYYLFAFHHINIFAGNVVLQNVVYTLKSASSTMLSILVMAFLMLYILSIFNFAFFRYNVFSDDNWYCETMFQCFVCFIRQGLIFDKWIDVFMPKNEPIKEFDFLLPSFFITMATFVIIFVLLLNIIAGVILDKFSETRRETERKKADMVTGCLLCNRSSFEFETKASGFYHHVENEHNLWAYFLLPDLPVPD